MPTQKLSLAVALAVAHAPDACTGVAMVPQRHPVAVSDNCPVVAPEARTFPEGSSCQTLDKTNWAACLFPQGASVTVNGPSYVVARDGKSGQDHSNDAGYFSGLVFVEKPDTREKFMLKLFKSADTQPGENFIGWRENIYKAMKNVTEKMSGPDYLGSKARLSFETLGTDALQANAPCWFRESRDYSGPVHGQNQVMGLLVGHSCPDGEAYEVKELPLEERNKMKGQLWALLDLLGKARILHFDLHFQNVMACEEKRQGVTLRRPFIIDWKSAEQLHDTEPIKWADVMTVGEMLRVKQGHLMDKDLLKVMGFEGVKDTPLTWKPVADFMKSFIRTSWLKAEKRKTPVEDEGREVVNPKRRGVEAVVYSFEDLRALLGSSVEVFFTLLANERHQ